MSEKGEGNGLEIASAIVLSVAALASSWASYQASLWDGEQAAHYSRANAQRIEASRVALEGDAMAAVEIQMFGAWLDAKARGQSTLADFYQSRFTRNFKPAFNAWIADRPFDNPSVSLTPFASPAYRRPGLAESRELDRKAEATFERGQYANSVSDAFQQGATLLAISLFFGGILQVFEVKAARIGLLVVAAIALLVGLLRISSLPLQILGFQPPG